MSAHTKHVLIFTPSVKGALVTEAKSNEGVFFKLEDALAYAHELSEGCGLPLAGFEVEGWRGRDFVGCWNADGMLIEKRERAGEVTTEEEPIK